MRYSAKKTERLQNTHRSVTEMTVANLNHNLKQLNAKIETVGLSMWEKKLKSDMEFEIMTRRVPVENLS